MGIYNDTKLRLIENSNMNFKQPSFIHQFEYFLNHIESSNLDDSTRIDYYYFKQAVMVKSVDTLLLGSSARASRFESEWRHTIKKETQQIL